MSVVHRSLNVAARALATFVYTALGVVIGSVLITDATVWQGALVAGAGALIRVAEKLARAAIDGSLTDAEIDSAFGVEGTEP